VLHLAGQTQIVRSVAYSSMGNTSPLGLITGPFKSGVLVLLLQLESIQRAILGVCGLLLTLLRGYTSFLVPIIKQSKSMMPRLVLQSANLSRATVSTRLASLDFEDFAFGTDWTDIFNTA
jgi:hypothetical protein